MSSLLFEQAVYGGEMEYANMVEFLPDAPDWTHPNLGQRLRAMAMGEAGYIITKYWPEEVPRMRGYGEGGLWPSNGARVYEDMEHPEYALQEVGDLDELVAAEIAGEELLYDVFRNAMLGARGNDPVLKRFALYKNVLDHHGTVCGYHEGYLTERDRVSVNAEDLAMLGLHLVSRSVYAGAGGILLRKGERGADYVVGQKMSAVNADYHTQTHPTRPVGNLRDESHAGRKFCRIHVTSGDPHISPAALKLQRGSTQLVLLASQMGYKDSTLRALSGTLHPAGVAIAHDRTLRQPTIKLENGKRISALEAQIALFGLVEDMLDREDRNGTHKEYAAVRQLWGDTLDKLYKGEDDPLKLPAVGWLHRLRWIEHEMDWEADSASAEMWADPQAILRNHKYARLGPKTVGAELRAEEWAADMPPRELIDTMKQHGSSKTRSGARGEFARTMHHIPDARVGWRQLILPGVPTFNMDNPREPYKYAVDEVLEQWMTDRQIAG